MKLAQHAESSGHQMMAPDSLRRMIVSGTPELAASRETRGHGQRECERWLLANAPEVRWLAGMTA